MICETNPKIRLLVAIASYGRNNDRYLAELVKEYRSMPFAVDIVVLSNVAKEVAPGVEVVVGLPYKDPWSLPFPHKQIFADRADQYDLFLYSEDDILITERNIRTFLQLVAVLPDDEIPGFFRVEKADEITNYPDIHGHFHWDPASLRVRAGHTLAFFSNEHAACYLLTRDQLKRAIASGGFLVGPHQGKYDLLCTAATDPYTQCGFRKLIAISQIDNLLVQHLPNKYIGTRFGVDEVEFRRQLAVLLQIAGNGHRPAPLFPVETKVPAAAYSKDCYEQPRQELTAIIPPGVRSVLSIGCGWGASEAWLTERGLHVTAVPVDPVIGGKGAAAGVEIVVGDLATARRQLAGRRFDCLLLLNVLHLVPEPVSLLRDFVPFLSKNGVIVSLFPNMTRVPNLRRKRTGKLGDYAQSGVHLSSHKSVQRWFREAGICLHKTIHVLPPKAARLSRVTMGVADPLLSSEFFAVGGVR